MSRERPQMHPPGLDNAPRPTAKPHPCRSTLLHGVFAVFTAWGWAKAESVELVPGEKMIVRAYDYYEADVVSHGAADKHSAYMIRGVCVAFMDLAYGGDYDATGATSLRTFQCAQTKGIERGDDYGEFVVTKA